MIARKKFVLMENTQHSGWIVRSFLWTINRPVDVQNPRDQEDVQSFR